MNGLVGVAAPAGIAAIGELELSVTGPLADSGYLIDITVLDRALREHATGRFSAAIRAEALIGVPTDLVALLAEIGRAVRGSIPVRVVSLHYRMNPFRACLVRWTSARHPHEKGNDRESIDMPEAILTETFEFAASHRLHLPSRSDEENRLLFGKCNNPNGHGHNYRIEVGCAAEHTPRGFGFADLQELVQREIMQRFDHKHLNLDCPEFRDLNPSVENIARVCHGLLAPALASRGATLRYVRVWETEKTSCIYPG